MTTEAPKPKLFSPQDAEAILQLARAAPLPNMAVAEQAAQVIGRYARHVKAFFEPPDVSKEAAAKPPETPPGSA